MASAPQIKQLKAEDFPGVPWIGTLLQPLNTFMGEVSNALSRNLTLGQNLNAELKTVSITMPAAGSAFPVKLTSVIRGNPLALHVGKVVEFDKDAPTLTGAVYADWSYKDNSITINNIYGLDTTAGRRFSVTLVIIGG